MIPVIAAPVTATAVTGAAMPLLVVSDQVQLAVVAGFFNTILNCYMLYLQSRTNSKIEDTKKDLAETKDLAQTNHDIVERRLKSRKVDSGS